MDAGGSQNVVCEMSRGKSVKADKQIQKLIDDAERKDSEKTASSDRHGMDSNLDLCGGGAAASKNIKQEMNRELLINDVINTSVMAALIGGFALSNLEADIGDSTLDLAIYLCAYTSVHLCTCSALTSALIYRVVNQMKEEAVTSWASSSFMVKALLKMPMAKFGGGCILYIVSVLLMSYRALEGRPFFQGAAFMIGFGSVSMIIMTWFSLRNTLK